MKREYLQLLHTKRQKDFIKDWWMSEKLDGGRAFWDGGSSRGVLKSQVPYANLWRDKKDYECTGLWSRLGNVIAAPDWFVDKLPDCPLDGELIHNDGRQTLMSITRCDEPGHGWTDVQYNVFDSPPPAVMFAPGVIRTPNMQVVMRDDCLTWWVSLSTCVWTASPESVYKSVYARLKELLDGCSVAKLIDQYPTDNLDDFLAKVVAAGGEGIVVRNPIGKYTCGRVRSVLKIKPRNDMEGTVTGYIGGLGKLSGMFGAAVLRLDDGTILELSGFTNDERELTKVLGGGEYTNEDIGVMIHIGDRLTFRYRGFTDDGVPCEAAYWRKK